MGKKRKIKNSVDLITPSATSEELAEFFGWDSSLGGRSALNAATYYACMQIRCNAFAKLPLKVKRFDGKGSVDIIDSKISDLLRTRPNRFTNAHDFKFATEFQRIEYGDAFWYMDFQNGELVGLHLLDSRNVQIFIDDTGILSEPNAVYYSYTDGRKGSMIFTENEICHFKNFSMNGVVGTPIKKYLTDTIDSELHATKMLKEKYKTGMQDPIIVQYVGELNKEKQNKIIAKFQKLGGSRNAGKVVPISPEFEVKQLETKLVNSQFFELQGMNARNIANAFGVKSFQLNDLSRSTYANIEQQNRAFYSDTLQNVLTSYEQEIDYKVLTSEQRKKGWYTKFNVDALLRSDNAARAAQYQAEINSGIRSIAEVRALEDLPYIDGTDGLIIGNGASIPLSQLGNQYAKGGE